MEHNQLSQMVNWLDKEHQRDRAQLHQLQQRVETLIQERQEQANRVVELEAEVAALHAHVDRVAQIEGFFERFKQEINGLLERSEARRQQAMRDSDRVRQVEIENVTQSINEFRQEIEKYRRYDEELVSCRADTQRLGESIARLQQQILETSKGQDERVRSITYLEEQRQQDNKRIAQLQVQITDVFKKVELQVSRIQQLEQFPPRIGELRSSIDELRQQQSKEIERVQFQDAQRERQVKSWLQEAEVHRQRMEEFGQQIERYAEQYHRIKKATEELQEFEEQIQRQQHESAELQRLAENRQRSQLDEWQAQEEQRWKKHTMEWDQHWGEYDKALFELSEQFTVLEKQTQENAKRLELLLRMAEEDAQMRAMATRDWQVRFEEIVEEE
jgi:chromosome segregation ATPase